MHNVQACLKLAYDFVLENNLVYYFLLKHNLVPSFQMASDYMHATRMLENIVNDKLLKMGEEDSLVRLL